jgi:Domain of unknown function (DUF1844)
MIGRDDHNEEEPVLKVMDKRKFNSDGSVREGVTIEAEKPKPQAAPVDEPKAETAEMTEDEVAAAVADDENELYDDADIPGAEDPASFVNFLSTLASQAAAALGAMPHPVTGQRTLDLETGKYWLEVLGMLKDKTKNNLHPKEQQLFDGILSDLRMQYVQIQRVAEEKLKQQAAKKFSASDILGKK